MPVSWLQVFELRLDLDSASSCHGLMVRRGGTSAISVYRGLCVCQTSVTLLLQLSKVIRVWQTTFSGIWTACFYARPSIGLWHLRNLPLPTNHALVNRSVTPLMKYLLYTQTNILNQQYQWLVSFSYYHKKENIFLSMLWILLKIMTKHPGTVPVLKDNQMWGIYQLSWVDNCSSYNLYYKYSGVLTAVSVPAIAERS